MENVKKAVPYQKEKQEILCELGSSLSGLPILKAVENKKLFGPNALIDSKKKSIIKIFLEQFCDFLVIILLAAAVISAFLGDWESSIVIFVVITMNAILGTVQQVKAEQSLNSLKKLSSPNAKVMRDGVTAMIPSEEVTVGDLVYLEAGDYICADGRIIENATLKINESALTGESLSVEKTDAVIQKEVPLGDRINMVFSGSFVTYGRGSFVVTDIGMETEVGKIASLLKNTKEKKTPLQVNLDQFGRKLSIIILVICGILFGVSLLRGQAVMDSFLFAVALAVAAIPEALSSIVTIVLSFGTQKMAKESAIIRKLQAVEGLGSISVICSDKTGTLTQNKMEVKYFYTKSNTCAVDGSKDCSKIQHQLFTYSVLCSDASIEEEKAIGDPTEVALLKLAETYQLSVSGLRAEYKRISEIPFDSDRKLMSTVNRISDTNRMITKGAVDVLLDRMLLSESEKLEIQKANMEFSRNGLRVLAFASKEVKNSNITIEDETGLEFIGLVAMMDPPRLESKKAVEECIKAGIKPVMITGDHKITAAAIAKQVGILQEETEAVEGAEIDSLSDDELKGFVENISVYARVSPEHKIRIVRAWQERGNIVAMTGDGVNDAPALKQADIGVAMGITGTEVAKDSASMVLADDNFATIVKAIENGRNVYANIKRSIQFLLSGNTAAILAVLYASFAGLPVPFAPVHLLFINLLTDSLPAIALGLEPHSETVMKEKPRRVDESILTKSFIASILSEGFIIGVMTMVAFYIGYQNDAVTGSTMAFSTLCLSRLVHGFNCKADRSIFRTKRFIDNPFLLTAFGIGFLLLNAVLLIPGLHSIFHVAALSMGQLFTVYGLSAASLIVIQIVKLIRKK